MKLFLLLLLLFIVPLTTHAQGVEASKIRRTTFTNLGTATDGQVRRCTNCSITAGTGVCASGGSGAWASANGTSWICNTNIPGAGAAPTDATYITQTANGSLSAEQAMGSLATGIVKNTTTTGVQSIAVAGTDYEAPVIFNASDFDRSGQTITIDYSNGQAASAGAKGFLISADWSTFNSKQSAITFGANVEAALGVAIGSAGAPVLLNGVGGTPSSVTLTNGTGLPVSTGVSGLGTGVATALAVNVGSAGAPVVNGGVLGTPSSGVGTNLTGTAAGLTAGNVTTNANSTGDITSVGNTTTLATVNGNVGTFGSATQSSQVTVNAKGLVTAAANVTVTPVVGSITGLGTGVGAALAVNVGTAGSPVLNGGALGSPSSAGTIPAHTLGGTISGGGNQINNVIIGTSTPLAGSFTTLSTAGRVDISSGVLAAIIGADSGLTTRTDATLKLARIGAPHYTNAEEPLALIIGSSDSAANTVTVGGGSGVMNAATALEFYTAANTTTLTGTLRMSIGSGGAVTWSSGVTDASGTPGSLCYNTSTFVMLKNNASTCTVSAREFKSRIASVSKGGLDTLLRMQPRQFAYNDNPARLRWGFVADELQVIDSKLADGYDAKGQAKSIDIPGILAVNTKSIQELHAVLVTETDAIRVESEKQKSIIIRLQAEIDLLKKQTFPVSRSSICPTRRTCRIEGGVVFVNGESFAFKRAALNNERRRLRRLIRKRR